MLQLHLAPALVALTAPVTAQTGPTLPAWLPTYGEQPGLSGIQKSLLDLVEYDGGDGPELILCGNVNLVGGLFTHGIAKWNGTRYLALADGLSIGFPQCLTVHDDGSGPALFVGGSFQMAGSTAVNRIARWDGASWSALGSGMSSTVVDLCVYDDGSGPALIACGSFTTAGGVAANRIAKWDGASWAPLGGGFDSSCWALAVFDDGSGNGPELYASGTFSTAGGVPANGIARWDGTSWSALGSGLNSAASSLVPFDDGSGPALFAAGSFSLAGGVAVQSIARFDGTSWSPLGSGLAGGGAEDLEVHDDGTGGGPALFVCGRFTSAGGVAASRIAKWDGSSWSALGSGLASSSNFQASTIAAHDDGSGEALFAGGTFETAGGVPAQAIARWKDASWSGLGKGLDGPVRALAEHDDGSGPAVFAGGDFLTAAAVPLNRVAKWSGAEWLPLGGGLNGSVRALTEHDDGNGGGPALFAGGDFTNRIAKWNGTTWKSLAPVPNGGVRALITYDDGGGDDLYAGGSFTSAGGIPTSRIARWDGSSWSALGSGMDGDVLALEVFDDGVGPALFAGGAFTTAGGAPASYVARWDGTSWSALGTGVGGPSVQALEVYAGLDGNTPALFVGGQFFTAGSTSADGIAKWDGSVWSELGPNTNGTVSALAVFDDGLGNGPQLHVGGSFLSQGVVSPRLTRWNGSNWSTIGGELFAPVHALLAHSGGTALAVGGESSASEGGDSFVASHVGSSGLVSYCSPGTSAAGCRALLSGAGIPSASAGSGFLLTATDVEGGKNGLFFFGTSGRQAIPWGNGSSYQCVAPPRTRLGLQATSGLPGSCDGTPSKDLNSQWQVHPNQNPGAGTLVQAQFWYRDPLNTSNQTTSLSDALEFTVLP